MPMAGVCVSPCAGDYHRFCFIDNGWQEKMRRIKGRSSVSDSALFNKIADGSYYRSYRITENLMMLHLEGSLNGGQGSFGEPSCNSLP
jgi:hypothetical protein